MQKRAVVVNVTAAVLGVAVVALGFAGEYFKHKALVASDTSGCHYRRTPALGCGVLAAALSLAAVALVTASSRCFGRFGGAAPAPAIETWRRNVRVAGATLAWLLVLAAAAMFLYGALRNAGGTGGYTATRRPAGPNQDGGSFDFVCTELGDGLFVRASIMAGFAIGFAISAYIDIVQKREKTITLGVAMERPHWSQSQQP